MMQIEVFTILQPEKKLRAIFTTTVRHAAEIRPQISKRVITLFYEIYTTFKLYAAHHCVTLRSFMLAVPRW